MVTEYRCISILITPEGQEFAEKFLVISGARMRPYAGDVEQGVGGWGKKLQDVVGKLAGGWS